MAFSSVIRTIGRSHLCNELETKLKINQVLTLTGVSRLAKGIIASALSSKSSLLVITATLEEAGRWALQLEAMGWQQVHLYPASEALPQEQRLEPEVIWGQMQVLTDLAVKSKQIAIVATVRALQPHLPKVKDFQEQSLALVTGMDISLSALGDRLTNLGYERTSLVETEGQWSRRGDIIDIFPVSSEMPVRIDYLGDQIERIREFDLTSQRGLDAIAGIMLTPTSFGNSACTESLLSYLAEINSNFLIAIDELDQCQAHSQSWYAAAVLADSHPQINLEDDLEGNLENDLADGITETAIAVNKLHRNWTECLAEIELFPRIYLSELAEENKGINLASRPIAAVPHQFGNLARTLREFRDQSYQITLVSAQPSRAVSLLQEHDCPAQFVPNPQDFLAIEKLQTARVPVAVKYSGLAEIQGFILPTFRILIVSDREFFGQHTLGSSGYVRKRRVAASKKVDLDKLSAGDYVVHRHHGIGQFLRLESLTINKETREYLVIQYEDGLLRVVADQVGSLSRFRSSGDTKPTLNKMTGKAWANTTNKVRKSIKKIAIDLLELYARRSQQVGYAFPPDMPWQQEMEDSFPYQPTPDQLKATQDVKQDMESDRPMDRLVCGDVGFGKTEVAIRALFKALTAGKQSALLAPTTILAQQHYHTMQERFAPYPINIALLNRFKSTMERKEIIQKLATGELDLVVGTHQLLSKEINFKNLGLLVIDEEQRFGVAQKEKIKSFKTEVDVLTLSATPIPRTLYMSLSGVREMSLITTPPPSRRSIKTHLSRYDPEAIRSAIRQELDRGGQVFYVVPRIEGIEETSTKLREMIPSARLAIAHGQMPEGELETTMLTFNSGEADILVCTTIIESGLDIPRVNTIIIEDAQKLGLAQLYQLRGRVGRSGVQAHAWLFYQAKGELSEPARQRLRAIQEFTHLGSGYQLAMRDMEIRGVGSLLGAEQSGQMEAIGFDLYMEMLQEAIAEIKGSEIPQVDDTQIDLPLTAFIPNNYIPDPDQKMAAYRALAAVNSRRELNQILEEWRDRYGTVPAATQQLVKVMELKQVAKKIGFSRIKPEGKQNIILETKMEEPAWKTLHQRLPKHLQSRFAFQSGKAIARGMAALSADKQLQTLIEYLELMQSEEP
ncbi:transcription-repair coupling factor Mfd [Synechococcus sp. PCC 7502]|uniref:transcription-repair coupling factor n=1 Tax=Synechococcus sp. PCC 7502 TaxID=1173263 RepID=UPI00029FB5AA|nr:transcription-repair coupling factor [Synechococcus sp. PCC 7502]AFY73093.1 transcription-repair coupling factor Mfd [Synechococcus sp. PCC 7502]